MAHCENVKIDWGLNEVIFVVFIFDVSFTRGSPKIIFPGESKLIDVYIYITPFISQADGIYDNPAELLDVKLEFSDDEGLNNSKNEGKVTFWNLLTLRE